MATRSNFVVVGMTLAGMLLIGCASADHAGMPADVAEGTSIQTIDVDGTPRTFRLFRPETLSSAAPLVIVIHGWGFSAEQAEQDYGWNEVAETHRFVVAYPEGVGQSFNAGGACCGPAADRDVDDVEFITAIVEELVQHLPIDERRIYAAGFSNGGVLAYTLACRTSLFAAIGAVAATHVGSCDDPRPTPVMHIHGTADAIVRLDGGAAVVPGAQPVPAVIMKWRRINDCDAPRESRRGPVITSTAVCPGNRDVTLTVIDGEGHSWPGQTGSQSSWDATAALWAMFSRHRS
jgi:polyhydroxybutyrate depolymerase